jgi:hypothetical protein
LTSAEGVVHATKETIAANPREAKLEVLILSSVCSSRR